MKSTPRGWTIGRTLLTITIVPPLVMLVLVAATLYFFRVQEIRGDIDERGRLVAGALAASSQYGVVSGNVTSLEQSVRALLESDASVAAIDILDAQRRQLVSIRASGASTENAFVFERPIKNQVLLVDLYDSTTAPHLTETPASAARIGAGSTVGYVRVLMSPAPLLAAKTRSLYLTGGLLTTVGLIGLAVGLLFVARLRRPMLHVLTSLRDMRRGNFKVPPATTAAPGELGQLQTTLVEFAAALATTTQELEAMVRDRTAQLEEAMRLLSLANDERGELIARGNKQIEEERERIAREMHDSLNASLVVLKLHTQCIADLAANRNDAGMKEVERLAQSVAATTDAIYAAARNIIKQLRPEVIDTLGLTGALAEMVRTFDELHPDCTFELHIDAEFPTLHGHAEIAAYRLVQEALSNVVKHAQAKSAVVRLAYERGASFVRIVVVDDGRGFDTTGSQPLGSLGLVGMRERAQALGGTVNIESGKSSGTKVTIVLHL